jgi:hypothetical protein
MRVIKGRKPICWLSDWFLLNVGWMLGELSLGVAAFQIGGEGVWENRRGVG